jgi:dihydropteroate synthase
MTCQVWGVLNVTPDSFSDGGKFVDVETAVKHGLAMVAAGASVVDVGGESTRPGAARIDTEVELHRTIPIIEALTAAGVKVSIDTMRAEVARAAVLAGASIVNDVSGGKADPEMFETVAALDCDYVLMHWRGHSTEMDQLTDYQNVVSDVRAELGVQIEKATAAGIKAERIILDLGFGFAKNHDQNWELLRALPEFVASEHRLLVGVSRKRMLAEMLTSDLLSNHEPADRDLPTAVVSFYAAGLGAYAVRVHDVSGSVTAIRVASALER